MAQNDKHTHTHGHGDSMTDPAQRAESVKIPIMFELLGAKPEELSINQQSILKLKPSCEFCLSFSSGQSISVLNNLSETECLISPSQVSCNVMGFKTLYLSCQHLLWKSHTCHLLAVCQETRDLIWILKSSCPSTSSRYLCYSKP